MTANPEILESLTLGDYTIQGFRWSESGDDIFISIQKPCDGLTSVGVEIEPTMFVLKFVWVERLKVAMDFGEYMGRPLLFDASFKHLPDLRWSVTLEFGVSPQGEIEFECNDIEIE